MRNNTSIRAQAMLLAAFASLSTSGEAMVHSTGLNKGDYQKPSRPRKFQRSKARSGRGSLDMQQYQKRYGLGFRYKIGSRPFSAQR